MEELEERHQVEIKVYKQKVKHLLYEHQNNVSQLKEEQERALKLQLEACARAIEPHPPWPHHRLAHQPWSPVPAARR